MSQIEANRVDFQGVYEMRFPVKGGHIRRPVLYSTPEQCPLLADLARVLADEGEGPQRAGHNRTGWQFSDDKATLLLLSDRPVRVNFFVPFEFSVHAAALKLILGANCLATTAFDPIADADQALRTAIVWEIGTGPLRSELRSRGLL